MKVFRFFNKKKKSKIIFVADWNLNRSIHLQRNIEKWLQKILYFSVNWVLKCIKVLMKRKNKTKSEQKSVNEIQLFCELKWTWNKQNQKLINCGCVCAAFSSSLPFFFFFLLEFNLLLFYKWGAVIIIFYFSTIYFALHLKRNCFFLVSNSFQWKI